MCAPSSLGEELSPSARAVVCGSARLVKTPRSDGSRLLTLELMAGSARSLGPTESCKWMLNESRLRPVDHRGWGQTLIKTLTLVSNQGERASLVFGGGRGGGGRGGGTVKNLNFQGQHVRRCYPTKEKVALDREKRRLTLEMRAYERKCCHCLFSWWMTFGD